MTIPLWQLLLALWAAFQLTGFVGVVTGFICGWFLGKAEK